METQRPGPTGETVDTPRHRALGSASRVAILRLVRASEAGMTTGEIASASNLHLSTARAHLDRLVGAGLLVRERAGGGVPGRPAWRYRPAAPDPAPPPYRALAAALLQNLADTDFDVWQTAIRAGEGWGLQLAADAEQVDAVTKVVRVLDGLGFTPQVLARPPAGSTASGDAGTSGGSDAVSDAAGTPGTSPADGAGVEIRLFTCPFLELVADHAETMCGLHLGVVRGVLNGTGAQFTDADLLPFGAPDACVLRLLDEPEPRHRSHPPSRRAGARRP